MNQLAQNFEQSEYDRNDALEHDIQETAKSYMNDLNAGHEVNDLELGDIIECKFDGIFLAAVKAVYVDAKRDSGNITFSLDALVSAIEGMVEESCHEAASSFHRGL